MRKHILLSATLAMSLVLSACGSAGSTGNAGGGAAAQGSDAGASLKGQNVTFICPWDAGGSSDAMTRKVAEMFGKIRG